jgi:hypothetical protein
MGWECVYGFLLRGGLKGREDVGDSGGPGSEEVGMGWQWQGCLNVHGSVLLV